MEHKKTLRKNLSNNHYDKYGLPLLLFVWQFGEHFSKPHQNSRNIVAGNHEGYSYNNKCKSANIANTQGFAKYGYAKKYCRYRFQYSKYGSGGGAYILYGKCGTNK